MRGLGLLADPWRLEVLHAQHTRLLLNCARQSGQPTVVAVLALTVPQVRVLLAGLLNCMLKAKTQTHNRRTMNRRLRRNEGAQVYHWHRGNRLPPRRFEQRT